LHHTLNNHLILDLTFTHDTYPAASIFTPGSVIFWGSVILMLSPHIMIWIGSYPFSDTTCVTYAYSLKSTTQMARALNTRNNSVAYLILLLSVPHYGAAGAFRNPAPSAEWVQKHKRLLFGSSHFLEHLGIECPEDAGPEWSALTTQPNPFTLSKPKNPILTDTARATISEGLDWFYEHAPTGNNDEELTHWVPSQLKQPDRAAFATAWGNFMKKIHTILVKKVDEYLIVQNLHPDQLAQDASCAFEDGSRLLSDIANHVFHLQVFLAL
jgi:hypothetical protein